MRLLRERARGRLDGPGAEAVEAVEAVVGPLPPEKVDFFKQQYFLAILPTHQVEKCVKKVSSDMPSSSRNWQRSPLTW